MGEQELRKLGRLAELREQAADSGFEIEVGYDSSQGRLHSQYSGAVEGATALVAGFLDANETGLAETRAVIGTGRSSRGFAGSLERNDMAAYRGQVVVVLVVVVDHQGRLRGDYREFRIP